MSAYKMLLRAGLTGLGLAYTVSPIAMASILEGRVSATSGETSLEGAIVTISETGERRTTSRDGRYRFADLPAGTYSVTVKYLGGKSVTQSVTISDEQTLNVDFTIGRGDGLILDNILVQGQRGAFYSARNKERAADGLLEVLSADAVGSLPDQNVAESVRRITGVSVANDQGEGRFVVIRGLNPNLSATSVNGVRLPAPEGDIRAVALDTVDSDALESIAISKTFLPEQDGDAIGGSLNIKTISGFDRDSAYLRAKVEAIQSEITDSLGGKASITAADQFLDGRLGIAGSATYNLRRFGSDNREVDSAFILDNALAFPEELELRDYEISRERISTSLNFDFRLTPNTDLYLRGVYNRFEDAEQRARVEIKLDDAEFDLENSDVPNGIGAFTDGNGEIEFDRQTRDRTEIQTIYSIQTGGESRFGDVTLDYSAAFSNADESEPNTTESVFRADDPDDVADPVILGLDLSDLRAPTLVNLDDATFNYFQNADNFEFDEFEVTEGFTEDQEVALAANLRYDSVFFDRPAYLKTGAKVRLRDKDRDVEIQSFQGFDGDDLTLAPFQQFTEFRLDEVGPLPGLSFQQFFLDNEDLFELDETDSALNSFAEDYDSSENIYAGYVQGQIDLTERLQLTGGVRIEHTDFSATGSIVQESDGSVDLGGIEVAEDVFVSEVSANNSYTDILPAFVFKYQPTDKTIIRAAYSRTLSRPTIGQQVPTVVLEIDDDEVQGESGNPDIDRQRSDNLDLSIDYYVSDNFILSGGVFYKRLNDLIATQVFQDFDAFGITFDELETAVNLDGADLFGLELSVEKAFAELPAPFDGFLIGGNVTFIEADAVVDGRTIDLPNLSDTVGSLIVGYDKYGLDLRAALSYRSESLDEIDRGGDGIDRFIDDFFQLDLSAKYKLTDGLSVTGEIQNVTNEQFEAFLALPDGSRALSQFEEYGVTYRLGLRYTF